MVYLLYHWPVLKKKVNRLSVGSDRFYPGFTSWRVELTFLPGHSITFSSTWINIGSKTTCQTNAGFITREIN